MRENPPTGIPRRPLPEPSRRLTLEGQPKHPPSTELKQLAAAKARSSCRVMRQPVLDGADDADQAAMIDGVIQPMVEVTLASLPKGMSAGMWKVVRRCLSSGYFNGRMRRFCAQILSNRLPGKPWLAWHTMP